MSRLFSISDVLHAAVSTPLPPSIPMIEIVDVGAMMVGQQEPPYAPLLRNGLGRVVGFEPVAAECERLNAQAKPGERFLPYFIGDGSERTFYLTNYSMTSSLYEPNTALLKRFQNLENLTQVVETSNVQTRRLDDLTELSAMHYLKADIQGAELDMLHGAEQLLAETLVLHIEVEFLEMYKGQPLFGDVDVYLRSRGFSFHGFLGLMGRCYHPVLMNNDPNKGWRQHIWSDVLYVRDFMTWKALTPDQLLQLATILHDCYQSVDLAALALQHYQQKTSEPVWDQYIRRLTGHIPQQVPLD
jgi:FkbM family methyltransferase